MRYFRPKSMTWWSGVFAIVIGLLMMAKPESLVLPELAEIIMAFAGGYGASPASLIVTGFGLIGIREKLERMM